MPGADRGADVDAEVAGDALWAVTEEMQAIAALTSRERQLIEFAGRGLSNAEIADRLVLSVRTVESHLYRAMHKLGITNRRDLPARPGAAYPA
ncbi:MAG: helix-turn-helix domain-containing protein [Streptosporangiaceae bacterium]